MMVHSEFKLEYILGGARINPVATLPILLCVRKLNPILLGVNPVAISVCSLYSVLQVFFVHLQPPPPAGALLMLHLR
jgi:hypothetical protein